MQHKAAFSSFFFQKSAKASFPAFHQRIFQYIANCHVPPNGEEGGWDVIYEHADGIEIPGAGTVHTVYVEMKNKHNTVLFSIRYSAC